MGQTYFSVGTALFEDTAREARLIARAATWLLQRRNEAGTWGGSDQLDRFISTNHVAMSLLAIGFPADSALLAPSVKFLTDLHVDGLVSFFWRSGVLLNLRLFRDVVRADADFIWRHRKRIGVHKDYPVPFFLLKLLRFSEPRLNVEFSEDEVLAWILEDWSDETCWYDRTSITSMALALVHDMDFPDREKIIRRCCEFLIERFVSSEPDRGRFSNNLVDDCFTVFNVFERTLPNEPLFDDVRALAHRALETVIGNVDDAGYWESAPPFGGMIDSRVYPTAVAIRAILSSCGTELAGVRLQVASLMLEALRNPGADPVGLRESIWGPLVLNRPDGCCFVLMPFEGKLTEIYERYVKPTVIRTTGLRCERADDVNRPNVVMQDVWLRINTATVIVADLTGNNANVFYELGLAHALGKPVVLIAQNRRGKKLLPFDVSGVRTILYADSPAGYENLASQLQKCLADIGLTSREP